MRLAPSAHLLPLLLRSQESCFAFSARKVLHSQERHQHTGDVQALAEENCDEQHFDWKPRQEQCRGMGHRNKRLSQHSEVGHARQEFHTQYQTNDSHKQRFLEASDVRNSTDGALEPNRKLQFICDRTGDEIVKEALRMVLEAIYDPMFLVYSHGHRPGLGEHSALKEIRRWVGISWFLKFRVRSCDGDKMKKHLTQELQQVIGDEVLLDMVLSSIQESGRQNYGRRTSKLGRLLTNIYLHQFDLSVARTIALYKRGDVPSVVANDGSEVKDALKRQGVRHILIANYPEFRRLWYVRHGTEFIMGFIGTRDDASEIFYDARFFIENIGIVMNSRKSGHVADSMQNPASFLGMRIVCEDPTPDRVNPHEIEWKARTHKLELIRDKDRRQRMMRKYVEAGKNALSRAADDTYELQVRATASKEGPGLLKEVIKHLRESIVGPDYRNIYHIMSPSEILLNRRTQNVFPPEMTEAAKELEMSLKAFVAESKKPEAIAQKPPVKRKELIAPPTMTPPEFYAPIRNIRVMLNNSMFLNRGRPTVHPYLARKTEIEIVEEFARVADCMLRYYKCSKNLDRVKRLVDYNLRFSCLRTLGERHKTTAQKIKKIFTSDLIVPVQIGDTIALRKPYPSSDSLTKLVQGFLARENPPPPWKMLQVYSDQRL